MDKYSEILMSFGTKETLNPKIWNDVDTDTPVLKNGIRVALLQIAGEFMDFLGEDLFLNYRLSFLQIHPLIFQSCLRI